MRAFLFVPEQWILVRSWLVRGFSVGACFAGTGPGWPPSSLCRQRRRQENDSDAAAPAGFPKERGTKREARKLAFGSDSPRFLIRLALRSFGVGTRGIQQPLWCCLARLIHPKNIEGNPSPAGGRGAGVRAVAKPHEVLRTPSSRTLAPHVTPWLASQGGFGSANQ
jgi:hypothetical protein